MFIQQKKHAQITIQEERKSLKSGKFCELPQYLKQYRNELYLMDNLFSFLTFQQKCPTDGLNTQDNFH